MRVSTERRRGQLVEAAIRLLMRDGVERVSLRAIATEAGASLAAVHVCFTDKDELMRAAMDGFLAQLTVSSSGRPVLKRGIRASATKIMDGFWKSVYADPNYALAQLEIGVWALRNPRHHDVIRHIYVTYEAQIVEILEKSQALSGEQPALSVSEIALGVVAVMDGCIWQYLADPTHSRARELGDTMIDALCTRAGI